MTDGTGLNPDLDDPDYVAGRIFHYLCELDAVGAGVVNDAANRPMDGLWFRKFAAAQANPGIVAGLLDRELPAIARKAGRRNPAAADRLLGLIADLRGRTGEPAGDLAARRYMFTLGHQHQWGADHRLLTPAEVADRYGYASADSARKEISRLGVESRGRDAESGAKLYSAEEIDRARAAKVGRGKGGGPKRRTG